MARGKLFGFLAGVILSSTIISNNLYADKTPKMRMLDAVPYSTVDSVYQHLVTKHKLPRKNKFILVYGREQKQYIFKKIGKNNFKILKKYDVSTGRNGFGNKKGSGKTSIGTFRIFKKYGDKAPIGTVFEYLVNTGKITEIYTEPTIKEKGFLTTRIITLKGLDNNNKNMLERCIYIHGTDREWNIKIPESDGCIRMRNLDVIDFYNFVKPKTLGEILE